MKRAMDLKSVPKTVAVSAVALFGLCLLTPQKAEAMMQKAQAAKISNEVVKNKLDISGPYVVIRNVYALREVWIDGLLDSNSYLNYGWVTRCMVDANTLKASQEYRSAFDGLIIKLNRDGRQEDAYDLRRLIAKADRDWNELLREGSGRHNPDYRYNSSPSPILTLGRPTSNFSSNPTPDKEQAKLLNEMFKTRDNIKNNLEVAKRKLEAKKTEVIDMQKERQEKWGQYSVFKDSMDEINKVFRDDTDDTEAKKELAKEFAKKNGIELDEDGELPSLGLIESEAESLNDEVVRLVAELSILEKETKDLETRLDVAQQAIAYK
jgi:hypothetical protein